MVDSCPIPTPEEVKYAAILSRIEGEMHDKIAQAINQASELAASELGAIISEKNVTTPPKGYFVSVAHQSLFCELCGAERETLEGGDVSVATVILGNYQGLRDSWIEADRDHSNGRLVTSP